MPFPTKVLTKPFRTIRRALRSKAIDGAPEFDAAVAFRKEISPTAEVQYDWVWDYSRATYDRLYAIGKELDDKANDLIKYLGGGTGLFTLAVLSNAKTANVTVLAWAIPSFVMAVASIAFAALARQPNETPIPVDASVAFSYASHYKDPQMAKGAFVGQWHEANEAFKLAIDHKADRVQVATWLFVLAIAALALPVIAAIR